jgi:inosine/xanthosine triphosphatase
MSKENSLPIKVVVASTNPVKLEAVKSAFEACFKTPLELVTVSVPSGVAEQPLTDAETLQGARNRAANALVKFPDAHYAVGLEGGIEDTHDGMLSFAWVVVKTQTLESRGRTATLVLPQAVALLVRQGVELGEANDRIFGVQNSKHNLGAVGLLTNGLIDRKKLYTDAVIMALIPFMRQKE